MRTKYLLKAAAFLLLTGGWIGGTGAAGPADAAATVKPVNQEACYGCHVQIKEMHVGSKHEGTNCAHCHAGTDEHLAKGPMAKPVTKLDHATCGKCHALQYSSFIEFNEKSPARLEKAVYTSRSPLFDKLIAGHGFAFEHNEPRQHAFMLLDHMIVDRAYGGRFQLKDWTLISDAETAIKDMWSMLRDAEPGTDEQKRFLPYVATAANPVCLNCKTQDHILKWKYMGDKDPRAQWDRTSKVVAFAKDLQHPLNCFMCHDPHSTQARVVRDGLIQAVVDHNKGTYPYDKEKSAKITMTKVTFRDFRAIGLLNQPDSTLMCAQCHVEYNCNPGFDTRTGEYSVTMESQLTNYFPWANVLDYKGVMDKAHFRDFKHAITGALITKLQHPEAETQWGSKHERAGVECKDCHMPKVKSGPQGKEYTWHGQKSAKYMLDQTCLNCHKNWSQEEADYQVEAIQNYIHGKIVKAEFWLGEFIDAFQRAKDMGVSEDVLKEARGYHETAHPLWEWWTAENSIGFHNPEIARESLAKSILTSKDGIKFLNDAVDALKKKSADAAPAAKDPAKKS